MYDPFLVRILAFAWWHHSFFVQWWINIKNTRQIRRFSCLNLYIENIEFRPQDLYRKKTSYKIHHIKTNTSQTFAKSNHPLKYFYTPEFDEFICWNLKYYQGGGGPLKKTPRCATHFLESTRVKLAQIGNFSILK